MKAEKIYNDMKNTFRIWGNRPILTPKARSSAENCSNLIRTALAISLIDVRSQHTLSRLEHDIWSVDK